MGRLVCELCNGNDFLKENGVFVCQNCGCKYSLEEASHLMKEDHPYLKLSIDMISKYLKGMDGQDSYIAISEAEYAEIKKYLDEVEVQDPGNWECWLYKGILEDLNTLSFRKEEIFTEKLSSFYYYDSAMKFAGDKNIVERILPMVERIKQLYILSYVRYEGKWTTQPEFIKDFLGFFEKYSVAQSYVTKTQSDLEKLAPVIDSREAESGEERKNLYRKIMKYTLDELNNYKNKLIEAFVEETLYPQRTSIIKDKIDKCKLYESGKKRELEFQQKKLERNKLEAEKKYKYYKGKSV